MPAFRRRDALAVVCGLAALLSVAKPQPALGGSATTSLGVSLTITAGCTVLVPSSGATMRASPAANVSCASSVPYAVASYSVLDIGPDAKGIVLTVTY